EWTKDVGDAFAAQPQDVMNAVQQLRARARAYGNLVATPQQEVVVDQGLIEILPVDPGVVYVPVYEPRVVYLARPARFTGAMITFGAGIALGAWIHNEFDWRRHTVWVRPGGWRRDGRVVAPG